MARELEQPSVADGVRLALSFAPADFVEGVAFGVIAAAVGLGASQAIVMSATAFSGSAQFASLTVVSDHGSLVAILLAVVALNARYLVFGASVAPSLSKNPLRRLVEAQMLTDASWALAVRDGAPKRALLVGAGATSLVAWTAGTAAGAGFGGVLGDYRAVGLDAALPAFFLCLLLERVRAPRHVAVTLCAGALALSLTPSLASGVPLLVVLAAALVWGRP